MKLQLYCLQDVKNAPVAFQKVDSDCKNSAMYICKLHNSRHLEHILMFTQGQWSDEKDDLNIDIFIVKGRNDKHKLCTLNKTESCFQWTNSDSSVKLSHSNKMTLEAVVTCPDNTISSETSENNPVSSPAFTRISLKESQQMKQINENTPATVLACEVKSPLPAKNPKKRKQTEETTPKLKARRQKMAMKALNQNTPPSKQALTELTDSIADIASKGSVSRITRCVDLSARAPKPSNRWGHTMSLVKSKLAVLIGGQGEKQLSRDSIWILDPEMRTWKCPTVTTEGSKPEFRIGHSATYDPTMRCIYIYGGSKNAKWFHDVYMFDLDENKWTLVKASGKAPTRAYHSTTLYRHELWIFGGVFPRPDPQPDGCDNEVHIFSPVMENWYRPIVTGEKPQPRSGHSATLINDLLVIFGGWDFPYCYNDLFILDLTTVDWSAPKVLGKAPKPRSWHASCALSNNRIFIHGGYDGDNALHDAFIFDLDGKSWQNISLENAPSARAGHACLRLPSDYENKEEDEIIVFGGGDNDGSYYNDMLSFYVPFNPQILDTCE
ncbi:unnamed protein product [Candidula unifasciata]|uniref:Kelch repeat-containing protein n=1 Tax=Candidula unifasciata TaxID=100452 RepID=A0A8S3Z979_9EUPU|nr:unnamed protein product [Candidula unifasciata]